MEYDFDEMAKQWLGIREAYKAYRGAGSDAKKQRFHTNLIKQLDYFFNHYPNPFGDDPQFDVRRLSEGQVDAFEKSDAQARIVKAKALLADIDETLDHHRRSGAGPEILERLRQQRFLTSKKLEQAYRDAGMPEYSEKA